MDVINSSLIILLAYGKFPSTGFAELNISNEIGGHRNETINFINSENNEACTLYAVISY